jgi:hypothetical protein
VYQQQEQQQEQEQQDAENPFLDPPFSRIKMPFFRQSLVTMILVLPIGRAQFSRRSLSSVRNSSNLSSDFGSVSIPV